MCDKKKYNAIYKEIEKLTPEDTLELILDADSQDEKDFYGAIGDFLLQRKQRDSIRRNVF